MFKKLTEITRTPSAESIAKLELGEARRSLLEAQSNLEYFEAMVVYHKKRVSRLESFTREVANA